MKARNLRLDELKKLSYFLIRDKSQVGENVYLEGVFKPRFDPSLATGFMYILEPPTTYRNAIFHVLWTAIDSTSSVLEYHSNWDIEEIAVGKCLPCGNWRLKQLLWILDLDTVWSQEVFRPFDAWTYKGSPGWTTKVSPGKLPPKDAKNVLKVADAWDHEHCVFCWATISEQHERSGFVGKDLLGDEVWVCRECYETKIVPHAL